MTLLGPSEQFGTYSYCSGCTLGRIRSRGKSAFRIWRYGAFKHFLPKFSSLFPALSLKIQDPKHLTSFLSCTNVIYMQISVKIYSFAQEILSIILLFCLNLTCLFCSDLEN